MDRDTLILIAFVAFVFLLGLRIRQRWMESKLSRKEEVDSIPEKERTETGEKDSDRMIRRKRLRRIRAILQLFVVGGLMVYMAVALINDFCMPGRRETKDLILRCLIFVFTIYIFIHDSSGCFGRKHEENT